MGLILLLFILDFCISAWVGYLLSKAVYKNLKMKNNNAAVFIQVVVGILVFALLFFGSILLVLSNMNFSR